MSQSSRDQGYEIPSFSYEREKRKYLNYAISVAQHTFLYNTIAVS